MLFKVFILASRDEPANLSIESSHWIYLFIYGLQHKDFSLLLEGIRHLHLFYCRLTWTAINFYK